tara:strand:- start:113 stop:691 length:579 start_codon:yes stop_codon:yes gene_type:complete
MARDITTAFNNAIKSENVKPIMAIELEISDGTLRFWTGYGNLTMNAGGSSKTFVGSGDLLNISPIEETSTLKMSGITVSMSGIKSSLISSILSAQYTNRLGTLYLGLFDTSNNVIADVYTLFQGKMDVANIQEGPETSVVQMNIESRLVQFELPLNRMFTVEDQKIDFPNDLGMEFIPDLQDKEVVWGKKTQ